MKLAISLLLLAALVITFAGSWPAITGWFEAIAHAAARRRMNKLLGWGKGWDQLRG